MTDEISDVIKQETVPTNDPTQSFLATLVGEGKKYANEEELARAYRNADLHIRELRDDLGEERKDKKMLTEVLEELRKPARTNGADPTPDDNVSSAPSNADPNAVRDMVREAMSEQEMRRIAETNRTASLNKLTEAYGSKQTAFDAIRKYIDGDNIKKELVDKIGNTDPQALFDLITIKTPPNTVAEPNTPGIKDTASASVILAASEALTWSKCREIKKNDINLYNSPAFRKKIEEASAADPDFYNK